MVETAKRLTRKLSGRANDKKLKPNYPTDVGYLLHEEREFSENMGLRHTLSSVLGRGYHSREKMVDEQYKAFLVDLKTGISVSILSAVEDNSKRKPKERILFRNGWKLYLRKPVELEKCFEPDRSFSSQETKNCRRRSASLSEAMEGFAIQLLAWGRAKALDLDKSTGVQTMPTYQTWELSTHQKAVVLEYKNGMQKLIFRVNGVDDQQTDQIAEFLSQFKLDGHSAEARGSLHTAGGKMHCNGFWDPKSGLVW